MAVLIDSYTLDGNYLKDLPKRLSNGWLVFPIPITMGFRTALKYMVSKDNGNTWSHLFTHFDDLNNQTTSNRFGVAGTYIYSIRRWDAYLCVDATTVTPGSTLSYNIYASNLGQRSWDTFIQEPGTNNVYATSYYSYTEYEETRYFVDIFRLTPTGFQFIFNSDVSVNQEVFEYNMFFIGSTLHIIRNDGVNGSSALRIQGTTNLPYKPNFIPLPPNLFYINSRQTLNYNGILYSLFIGTFLQGYPNNYAIGYQVSYDSGTTWTLADIITGLTATDVGLYNAYRPCISIEPDGVAYYYATGRRKNGVTTSRGLIEAPEMSSYNNRTVYLYKSGGNLYSDFVAHWTPPNIKVNVGGVQKSYNNGWVNVGGVWKAIDSIYTNVGGTWKKSQ